MYVRFRNYILIYETFFLPHSFLSYAYFTRNAGVAKICCKASLERKANENGLERSGGEGGGKRKARNEKKTKNTHK